MDDDLKKLLETMREENSAAHHETRAQVAALDAKLDSTAERLDTKIDSTAERLDAKLDSTAERLDAKIDSTAENLRRHFDVTTEATNSNIRLVAESVTQLTDEMRRGFAAADKKFDTTTAETQAMIKFSHANLDRRLITLEETVADLQTRVERLETTH